MIKFPKEILVHILRDFFSRDDGFYHYDKNEFGFQNTVSQKGLAPNAGISTSDHSTTRIGIYESYPLEGTIYPNIIVRFGSAKETMISFNKENGTIHHEHAIYTDPHTLKDIAVHVPKHFIRSGAWEGSLSIDISARHLGECDEITELVAMALIDIYFEDLLESGLVIKPISVSAPNDKADRNDKIHKQTINIDFRGEWERNIPIFNLIERIMVNIDFGDLTKDPPILAPDLGIQTEIVLSDMLWDADPLPL